MDALNDDNEKLRPGSTSNRQEEAPRPRSESTLSDRTLLNMSDSDSDEKRRSGDLEKEGLVEQLPKAVTKEHATKDPYARVKILMWMAINTLATVTIVSCHFSLHPAPKSDTQPSIIAQNSPSTQSMLIPYFLDQVFCNKAIFSDKSFSQCQAGFASFHFFVTAATLFLLSRPQVGMFEPRKIPVMNMLPLAIAMAMNIVGMNVSLQVSTITFYQITRVLLTPIVAIINFFFYKKTIPRMAVYALIPMCFGVALISYYDKPATTPGAPTKAVGALSVLLAIGSVTVSGIYTIWIGTYQRKFDVNGFQLLFNQAPLGGVLLLYVVPWTDKFPALDQTPAVMWGMILLSGFLAALINLSQFFIIGGSGPLESTVVGHLKTCLIVVIGAFSGGRVITDKAALGILLALVSIFS